MMTRPLRSLPSTASVAAASEMLADKSCVVVLDANGRLFGVIDRIDLSSLICRSLGGVIEAAPEYFDWAVEQHQLAKLTVSDVVLGCRRAGARDSYVAIEGEAEMLDALDALIAAGAEGGLGPRRIITLEGGKPKAVVSMSDLFHEWLTFTGHHPELDRELATRAIGTCFDPESHRPACRVRVDETIGATLQKMISANTDVSLVADAGGSSIAVITASDLREWSLTVNKKTGLVMWSAAFGQMAWTVGQFLQSGSTKRQLDIRGGAAKTPEASSTLIAVDKSDSFKKVMALMEANRIHHIVIRGEDSNSDLIVGSKDFVKFFAQNPIQGD